MSPLYSIIIPAYNEEKFLPDTLDTILVAMRAQAADGELIVVDNNSSDSTAEIAKAHGARVVFEPVNRISSARNAGARLAEGEFLIFVDADTRISPALLSAALGELSSGRACGGGAKITFNRRIPFLGRAFTFLWNTLAPYACHAAGCFIFCRRDAFDETGGFDERIYASEEIGLSVRVRRWGKSRKMKFRILKEEVITSARKFDWHSSPKMFLVLLMLSFLPFAFRSRRFCYLWYHRP